MQRAWLFTPIPLTIATVSFGLGVYGLRRAGALRRDGANARAPTVRHDIRRSNEGTTLRYPVLRQRIVCESGFCDLGL
ncbi:hypothetical protein [Streptomyces sp. TLI_146]|uniref:hypothetical protein n=1 Tax=Streptomyces sp. TLI_146 TaxID=1938858 RepID=UPI000CB72E13|nr:hypothetical protein [Streptomyces sp. TLI_146]PKV90037.1 hypothetical protein BX283_7698 [Streptomyces sp. TLI_146]